MESVNIKFILIKIELMRDKNQLSLMPKRKLDFIKLLRIIKMKLKIYCTYRFSELLGVSYSYMTT